MEYQNIKFNTDNGIAHIVLDRDAIRNAFSDQSFTDELVNALEQTQQNSDARVLLLSANGSAFSSGGNIKDMRDKKGIFGGGAAGTRTGYIEGIQKIPKALYALDIPSVCAVQGPAIGA